MTRSLRLMTQALDALKGGYDAIAGKLFTSSHSATVITLELTGLEAVRAQYIAHWPAMHARVHQAVQKIVSSFLDEGEVFSLAAPDVYSITLRRSDMAAERCADILCAVIERVLASEESLRAIGCKARLGKEQNAEAAKAASRVEIAFLPVTSLADHASACHAAVARTCAADSSAGHFCYGYDVLPVGASDHAILDLDIRMVNSVYQLMERMERIQGYPGKVLCPVHFRTVVDPERFELYLKAFSTLQQNGYDRLVALQLFHDASVLEASALRQVMTTLARLSGRVVVMQPLDWVSTGELAEAGAQAVGLDFQHETNLTPDMAGVKMRAFVRQAARENLSTYVFGAEGVYREVACAAGFSYLCNGHSTYGENRAEQQTMLSRVSSFAG